MKSFVQRTCQEVDLDDLFEAFNVPISFCFVHIFVVRIRTEPAVSCEIRR